MFSMGISIYQFSRKINLQDRESKAYLETIFIVIIITEGFNDGKITIIFASQLTKKIST